MSFEINVLSKIFVSMMDISTGFREHGASISSFSEGLFLHYPFFEKNNMALDDAKGWSMTQFLQLLLKLERLICFETVL